MKKHIASLLLVLLGFAAYSNAQDIMVVEKKDKTTVKYNVDDVQRVFFEAKQSEPSFTITPSTESGGTSTTGVSNLTQTGVTISAKITVSNTTGTYYCGIAIDKTSSVTATSNIDKKTSSYSGNGTKTVSYSFSGLSSSTTYYYVVYILYGGKYYYGAVKSFTTTSTPTPSFTATTNDATNIGQTTATLNGTFNIQNATASYKIGFYISTSSTPTSSNALKDYTSTLTNTNYSGDRNASATGLTANTKYYFRAYILCDGKYYYGTTKSFTTNSPAVSCTATTNPATEIAETTATLNGTFVVKNATKSYTVGFLLSTNSTPTTSNALKNPTKSLSDANYDKDLYSNITGLTANTKYYFRAYILYDGVPYYGATRSFTTNSSTPATTGTLNGHAWVDLGLPDGTKWATCNVGASTPEDYGDYYAWGETTTKATYEQDNWKYKNVNIGVDIAGTQYDVAHVKWGSTWKMPSKSQMETLMNNCSHAYTTQNGVKGIKFTGPNGNSIFLPAARGYRFADGYGMYWTSTGYYEGTNNTPYYLEFTNRVTEIFFIGGGNGFTIRPVTK